MLSYCSVGRQGGLAMPRFSGATIMVTGAASGIGRACAVRLLSEGASVIAADVVEPEGLEGSWQPVVVDVRDPAAVAAACGLAARLDGVVNAAGVAGGGAVHLLD